jgi:hypothetical protein
MIYCTADLSSREREEKGLRRELKHEKRDSLEGFAAQPLNLKFEGLNTTNSQNSTIFVIIQVFFIFFGEIFRIF